MNYYVEGRQGGGKSTLTGRLAEKYPDHKVYEEDDYSPVELAWCAYMNKEDYLNILDKYSSMREKIEEKAHTEDDHIIVCYTKVKTDKHEFYQDMEKYEIYNNRISFGQFKEIVLGRFEKWDGEPLIAECSLFQNTVEDLILFRDMSDEGIMDLYREIKKELEDKQVHIAYIKTEPEGIRTNLENARKERVDDKGNEVWFSMLCNYFDNCPHAVRCGLEGEDGLVRHWIHRQELELRICEELFPGQYSVFSSKNYGEITI